MRIFITGGSSALGEIVLPRLAEHHEVWALARSEVASRVVKARAATPVPGSLEDCRPWSSAIHEADAVVHLAGMKWINSIIHQVQAQQPLTVISSASALTPAHPRAAALMMSERKLRQSKPDALVVLRPTMIYGTSTDRNVRLLTRLLLRLPLVPRLTGGASIQPVLADDIADAIIGTLGTRDIVEGNVAGPVPLQLGELVAQLAALLDRPTVPLSLPITPLIWLGSMLSTLVERRGLHALAMLRHDRSIAPDNERLGGRPATPLALGLPLALSRYNLC